MKKFRFFVLGLAHVPTHKSVSACAYTQKIVKLCTMLKASDHEVIFLGTEGSDVACDEFVQVLSKQTMKMVYGDNNEDPSKFFKHDPKDLAYTTFMKHAIAEINKRKKPTDFLLNPMGNYYQNVQREVGLQRTVESGIGYSGVCAGTFKVWESYAWMHHIWGMMNVQDGLFQDCVIPNYWDVNDFTLGSHDGGYALYMGRLIYRKGLNIAVQVTKELNMPLLIVGQGSLINPQEGLQITEPHVKHLGTVGPEERNLIMGKAQVTLCPTLYVGPFEGVNCEAQLTGCPVITTNFGAFTETVEHGKTGYRCQNFEEFCWATKNAHKLESSYIRHRAMSLWSLERVREQYDHFFQHVDSMCSGKGWYSDNPERTSLDWLKPKDFYTLN